MPNKWVLRYEGKRNVGRHDVDGSSNSEFRTDPNCQITRYNRNLIYCYDTERFFFKFSLYMSGVFERIVCALVCTCVFGRRRTWRISLWAQCPDSDVMKTLKLHESFWSVPDSNWVCSEYKCSWLSVQYAGWHSLLCCCHHDLLKSVLCLHTPSVTSAPV